MKSTVSLQIDSTILLKLVAQLCRRGGSQDLSEAITSAITCWLEHPDQTAAGGGPAGMRGYQWKSLFLPDGTVLCSWSYGEHNCARVENGLIMHQGRAVSPNQFAQSFARSTRNAWTDLSVRRPGDKNFKSAYRLRQELTEQEKAATPPGPALTAPSTDPVSLALAALLSQLTTPVKTSAAPPSESAPSPQPRDCTPGPGWTLQERRQYRYRMEDVAFE